MLHILRKAALHVTVKYIECVSAGQMSDAAELLMALYDALLPVAAKANQPGLLGAVFGIHVKVCLCLPLSSEAATCMQRFAVPSQDQCVDGSLAPCLAEST